MRILAISGSLRAASLNTALLRAAIALVPEGVTIALYGGIGGLPLFNPDLEQTEPSAVTEFRAQVQASDGLMIASPEYAHGVTGTMKNALDWLVSGEEFVGKPIALLNASQRATHAQAALAETITTMSGRIVAEASVTIPLLGRNLDAAGILADAGLSGRLRAAIVVFVRAIEKHRADTAENPATYPL